MIALDRNELDNVLARWNIAKAYQALEKDSQAQASYEDLLADLADNPEFLADYIDFLRQTGQQESAKHYAKAYLQLVPDDVAMQEFFNQE